jgi:hypothetical protein
MSIKSGNVYAVFPVNVAVVKSTKHVNILKYSKSEARAAGKIKFKKNMHAKRSSKCGGKS